MSEANDDLLRKIQALLDKADRTDFGAERDAYRAKADEMMLRYSVEQYQLEEVRRARGEAVSLKPITKDIVVPWHTFAQKTYDLLLTLGGAVGVRTLYRGWDHGWRVTLIGFEIDVRYVEMLWTALRVQMLDMMEPSVDPGKSFEENVFALRQAGMNWMQVRRRMNEHVTVEWHPIGFAWNDEEIRTPRDEKERQNKHIVSQFGPWPYCCDSKSGTNTRLLSAYRRQCEMHGVDPAVIRSTEGYRNAWADSFRSRIRQRLMEKRGAATETGLVLARKAGEIEDVWQGLYDEMHKDDKPVEKSTNKRRVAKYVAPAWDPQGAARGRAAADKADLSRLEERISNDDRKAL